MLSTDISTTGIIFEDCVVGMKYYKDFNVLNKSEIDLFWKINTQDIPTSVSVVDIESGVPLLNGVIPSYSMQRIRLLFIPNEVGELDYDLLIENVNDSSNTVQVHIHSFTRQSARSERLLITSGHNIDFGDCCAGIMKKQRMMLKNVGDTPLEISFGTDRAQDVYFRLLGEEEVTTVDLEQFPVESESRNSVLESDQSSNDGNSDNSQPIELSYVQEAEEEWDHDRGASELSLHSRTSSSSGDSQTNQLELEMFLSKTLTANISRSIGKDAAESNSRVEEIVLKAGSERIVEVCYMHPRENGAIEGKFAKQFFKLFLLYSVPGVANTSDKATVQCVARVCTSVVKLNTDLVDFGNSDVGTVKQGSIEIINVSDLPAIVKLKYESKVLTSLKNEIIIPPRQKTAVKLDFYPRKINPDYRKQITVVNVLNPENELTFTVHSFNVDKQRVTLHSNFYQFFTAGLTHFVDFGVVSVNSTVLRAVTVENITENELLLKLDSSVPEELKLFELPQTPSKAIAHMSVDYKAKVLQKFEVGNHQVVDVVPSVGKIRKLQRTSTSMREVDKLESTGAQNMKNSNTDYLDLAVLPSGVEFHPRNRAMSIKSDRRDSKHRESDSSDSFVRKNAKILTIAEDAENFADLSLPEFLTLAEKESGFNFPLFGTIDSEELFVKRRRQILKRLKHKIKSNALTPVSMLSLKGRQKKTIYFVLEVHNDPKKYSKVITRLIRQNQRKSILVYLSKSLELT